MKSRVSFHNSPGGSVGTGISISWQDFVEDPFNAGYYAEAFASADALIDHEIESILRQIYSDFKSQDLINELHHIRSKTNFQGLVILDILKSKTVIDEKLYQRVINFKKARNLVSHEIQREYALIPLHAHEEIKDQKEFDELAKKSVQEWVNEAEKIFQDLSKKSSEIYKKEDKYFSHDFYQKNPRIKQIKKKYPSMSTK